MNDSGNLGKSPRKSHDSRAILPSRGTRKELFEKCAKRGIDVFDRILELCEHPDPEIAGKNLERAANRLYPGLKAIEISGELDINREEHDKAVSHMKELYAKGMLKIGTNPASSKP